MKLYYLGKIAQQRENNILAISYFQPIDSMFKKTNNVWRNLKECVLSTAWSSINGLNDDQAAWNWSHRKAYFFDSFLITIEQKGNIQQATRCLWSNHIWNNKEKGRGRAKAKSSWFLFLGFGTGLAVWLSILLYQARKTKIRVKQLLEVTVNQNQPYP